MHPHGFVLTADMTEMVKAFAATQTRTQKFAKCTFEPAENNMRVVVRTEFGSAIIPRLWMVADLAAIGEAIRTGEVVLMEAKAIGTIV